MTDYRKPLPKGVPELPDGYFYRLKQSIIGSGDAQVRREHWYGSSEESRISLMPRGMKSSEFLVKALTYAHRSWIRDHETEAAWAEIVGDYSGQHD